MKKLIKRGAALLLVLIICLVWSIQPINAASLSAPSSVKVESLDYNVVRISWNPVFVAHGYEIWRSTSKNSGYSLVMTTHLPSNIVDMGLTCGTTYYYKIRAYKISGSNKIYSSYSSIKSVKPVPSIPNSFQAEAIAYNEVRLSWAPVPGATKYEIYRAFANNGTYRLLNTTSNLSYIDKKLATGKRFFYKIRAIRQLSSGSNVYSDYTVSRSAKPTLTEPLTPQAWSSGASEITVNWGSVEGANGYGVLVSKNNGPFELADVVMPGSKNSYVHKNLSKGAYKYQVVAGASYNILGPRSKHSNSVTVGAVSAVFLDKAELAIDAGKTEVLNALILPIDASNKNVTWSSSDSNIARVDQNGNVTGVNAGTAIITVTTQENNLTASCEVTVIEYIEDGIYYFHLKGSSKVMNLYAESDAAADKDGTKVTLWDQTRHTTQRFRVLNIGLNRVRIYAISSSNGTNRVLDVNTGSSGKPQIGNYIDIWRMTEASEQEWKMTKTTDGYYKIELCSLPGAVIGCSSPNTNGAQLQLQSFNGSSSQLWKPEKIEPSKTILPLASVDLVSSNYGWRTYGGYTSFHYGIDLLGSSKIVAVADGTVKQKGYDNDAGNYVVLEHSDGYYTLYFHCSSLLVNNGQKVSKGQNIAIMGNTGDSGGVHLHFAVRKSWNGYLWYGGWQNSCINPADYVPDLKTLPGYKS